MAGKSEIVEAIANDAGLSKKDATAAFEAFVNTVAGALKKGDRVAVPGLGIFSVAERKARTGINPQTKEKIKIKAAKAARFKAGKDLKDLLNPRRGGKKSD
ncbi:MAG: HU family DNA-binding protein [Acidobacteria bacterium]|nr:HU family DNA-binding protein [Acidobacteriota bacterium]MCG3192013.1 DNA-binding protein HU [Thermoanaerobaculia bacterium]MCK6684994.1 HU family DNA-binding protein [Thermoanaerobaculia bacterium]